MQILVATENEGKLSEIFDYLQGEKIDLVSQVALGFKSERETGCTFLENALTKARNACRRSGLAVLAEDSGLVVPSLGGSPGVHSAHFAGDGSDDQENISKLLLEMKTMSGNERKAYFVCVMVYLRGEDDPIPCIHQGFWEGVISDAARGTNGFGYDSVFFDPNVGKTAGELNSDEKSTISHRGQALRGMIKTLKNSN